MRVAALYDIHGNLPALEAVLQEIDRAGVAAIVVGGDIVSGPLPRATIDLVMALGSRVYALRGNADREVVAAFDGHPLAIGTPNEVVEEARWVAAQLERPHRDYLAQLPAYVILSVEGLSDVRFCHGSPRSDKEILTRTTPAERVRVALGGVAQQVVVCGHTHMQYDRRVGTVRLINAGSVGMPYGAPGAYWALLGPDIALQHTAYDLEAAAKRIRASGHPGAGEFANQSLLAPPTAAEALAVFERLANQRHD